MTQSLTSSIPQSLTSLVIHGHFYQPPRENPWLEEVEIELSAAPFHDWNERINHESYRAVTAARVLGREGRIARIINTLSAISFNFGPTLLAWMETAAPDTYTAVLEADRESVRRWGHGNAIAHPFHHVILPLSTRRDKVTEVRWGIRDFKKRFGRDPEGMWLPETAVDDETLEVLADEGIRFTILAPHQARPLPPNGLPGLYRTRNGKSIAIFLYDGDLAHGIAFGELIRDAGLWISRVRAQAARHPGGLVSIATDGETYGHHHKFGEMALASVISEFGYPITTHSESTPSPFTERGSGGPVGVRLENFATLLARNPASHEVTLNAPSSWSCAHGVGRWKSECGCKTAPHLPTQQKWRAVLRDTLDWLAGEIHATYERQATPLFDDIWSARDQYDPTAIDSREGTNNRIKELLELERHALLIYTSCAWFFDDLAGLEPVQVLKYAARAIELTGGEAPRLEAELLRRLASARSNDPSVGNGSDLYLSRVKPRIPAEVRLAAGLALLADHDALAAGDSAKAFRSTVTAAGESGWVVKLVHRRTSREYQFRVALLGNEMEVALAEDSYQAGLTWRLIAGDLWDRHRASVLLARRRRLVQEALSPAQHEALAKGETDLGDAARAALTEAVHATAEGNERDIDRAMRAIDLLAVLGLAVPFDAQTQLARGWASASPDARQKLSPLAFRLGFDVTDETTIGNP